MIDPRRWQKLAGILTEASTLPATNDSVDGPYTEIVDDQPMGVDKNINRELVEQKLGDDSPESRDPSREDAEEAMAMYGGGGYPATAAEYAQQLNAEKPDSGFKLVDDPEHWAEHGIRTGEELAKYLAIESYRDVFKDVYGTRPRHKDFSKMSIEEIEKATDDLLDQMQWEEDELSPASRGEEEDYRQRHPEQYDAPPEPDEYDVQFGKYEDLESDWDDKVYGKR